MVSGGGVGVEGEPSACVQAQRVVDAPERHRKGRAQSSGALCNVTRVRLKVSVEDLRERHLLLRGHDLDLAHVHQRKEA